MWIDEMIGAALDDEGQAEPDFARISAAASARPAPIVWRRAVPAAAAALIAAGSLGAFGLHRQSARIVREEASAFVEQLVGSGLFDEENGLDASSPWLPDDPGFLDL